MRNFNWLASTAAALALQGLALPAVALAQGAPAPGNDFISRHDKNGDGKVTMEEVTTVAQEQLAAADKDKDGSVTVEELNGARAEARFKALDKDQSGGVSLEEFQAQQGGRGGRMGGGRDQDGDGKISLDELTGFARQMFERADADKDGALTAEELTASRPEGRGGPGGPGAQGGEGQGPGAEGQGRRGGRGRGSPEEAFKRLDTDGNGELSQDELKAQLEGRGRGGRGGRGGQGGQGGRWI